MSAPRSAWHPDVGFLSDGDEAQELLDCLALYGISRLFLDSPFPVFEASKEETLANLKEFLGTAHESGIAVEAVFGNRDYWMAAADPSDAAALADCTNYGLEAGPACSELIRKLFDPGNEIDPGLNLTLTQVVMEKLDFMRGTDSRTGFVAGRVIGPFQEYQACAAAGEEFDAFHYDVEFWVGMSVWSKASDLSLKQLVLEASIDLLDLTRDLLGPEHQLHAFLTWFLDDQDPEDGPEDNLPDGRPVVEAAIGKVDLVNIAVAADTGRVIAERSRREVELGAGKQVLVTVKADSPGDESSSTTFHDEDLPTMLRELEEARILLEEAPSGFAGFSVFDFSSYRELNASTMPMKLHFAQFAKGGGLSSVITLLNRGAADASLQLDIRDDLGMPATVVLNGSQVNGQLHIDIPAFGVAILETDSQGEVVVGSVTATSDQPLAGVILFAGPLLGLAGVGSSQPLA
ncbi:MAG: hypothetical protein V3T83_06475, partial [Acidobacteriota bacterium]